MSHKSPCFQRGVCFSLPSRATAQPVVHASTRLGVYVSQRAPVERMVGRVDDRRQLARIQPIELAAGTVVDDHVASVCIVVHIHPPAAGRVSRGPTVADRAAERFRRPRHAARGARQPARRKPAWESNCPGSVCNRKSAAARWWHASGARDRWDRKIRWAD